MHILKGRLWEKKKIFGSCPLRRAASRGEECSHFLCETQTWPPVLLAFFQPILTFLRGGLISSEVTGSVCQALPPWRGKNIKGYFMSRSRLGAREDRNDHGPKVEQWVRFQLLCLRRKKLETHNVFNWSNKVIIWLRFWPSFFFFF